jgi:hypothetical protein
MRSRQLEEDMRRKRRADVEFASMTYAQRSRQLASRARTRRTVRAAFTIVGLTCGVGSTMDVIMLIALAILGPIALRYDQFL